MTTAMSIFQGSMMSAGAMGWVYVMLTSADHSFRVNHIRKRISFIKDMKKDKINFHPNEKTLFFNGLDAVVEIEKRKLNELDNPDYENKSK